MPSKPPGPHLSRRADSARTAAEPDLTPNRRHDILVSAERLFSTRGFHGVSIRDIAEDAGVPLALVGYYFGPKVDLYHAIYRERAGYIGERLNALAAAQREAAPGQLLEEIVKAFVLPVLDVAADPARRNFLRLLSRGMSDHLAEDEPMIRELFDPLAHAFIDAMHAAVPGATRSQIAWCYQFALGALLHHVTDHRIERLSLGENRPGDGEAAGPLLVAFLTQGIRGACAAPRH
jgi:AcrR family transcriptional regulator